MTTQARDPLNPSHIDDIIKVFKKLLNFNLTKKNLTHIERVDVDFLQTHLLSYANENLLDRELKQKFEGWTLSERQVFAQRIIDCLEGADKDLSSYILNQRNDLVPVVFNNCSMLFSALNMSIDNFVDQSDADQIRMH